jgi:hypothetical protein
MLLRRSSAVVITFLPGYALAHEGEDHSAGTENQTTVPTVHHTPNVPIKPAESAGTDWQLIVVIAVSATVVLLGAALLFFSKPNSNAKP